MSQTNKKSSVVDRIIGRLSKLGPKLPDNRTGRNLTYQMADIVKAAFAVFFTQSPSFLAHQRALKKNKGKSNAQSIFGMDKIPCDQHIRDMLDHVSPEFFYDEYKVVFDQLDDQGLIEPYRVLGKQHILLSLDGSEYFGSTQLECQNCLHRTRRNGEVQHYHSAILPAMVAPDNPQVIPLAPEFISPQDGAKKQDCERKAGKRWIESHLLPFSQFSPILLGDDLYANQPFCETVLAHKGHFVFVCKPNSHVTLYSWLEAKTGEIQRFSRRIWNGKHGEIWQYSFLNQVPLRAGDDALAVNWCQLHITHQDTGKTMYRNAFITDLLISSHNVPELIKCGRARWKVENENYNTLKTKGYHLEHNFGHGDQYLAMTLLTLNILAFLLHTVSHLSDKTYRQVREALGRRDTFFNDVRALTRYLLFDSWRALLEFMFIQLELRPEPD